MHAPPMRTQGTVLHGEDGKGICLLFPSSSFLGKHQRRAAAGLSSVPARGCQLTSASREFRGKCWVMLIAARAWAEYAPGEAGEA